MTSGWSDAMTRAMAVEFALLLTFSALWIWAGGPAMEPTRYGLIAVSAIAMGIQSAAAHAIGMPGITTTYFTGTMTNVVARAVGRTVPGKEQRSPQKQFRWPLAAFAAYVAGAAATGFLIIRAHILPPLTLTALPAVTVALVVVVGVAESTATMSGRPAASSRRGRPRAALRPRPGPSASATRACQVPSRKLTRPSPASKASAWQLAPISPAVGALTGVRRRAPADAPGGQGDQDHHQDDEAAELPMPAKRECLGQRAGAESRPSRSRAGKRPGASISAAPSTMPGNQPERCRRHDPAGGRASPSCIAVTAWAMPPASAPVSSGMTSVRPLGLAARRPTASTYFCAMK